MLLVQRWSAAGPGGEEAHGSWRSLLIDCGPQFKSAAALHLPALGFRALDAVVLTHGHVDAIVGLNDLREVQALECEPGEWNVRSELPVHANQRTLEEAQKMFPFLFPKPRDVPFATLVGRLAPRPLEADDAPFEVQGFEGMPIQPLPVEHGRGYVSLGFAFGEGEDGRVAYISDASSVPRSTLELLARKKVAVLILDAIAWDQARPSHFSVLQALEVVREVRPGRALLVGMSCALPHEATDERLRGGEAGELPCPVELAYDGLLLEIDL